MNNTADHIPTDVVETLTAYRVVLETIDLINRTNPTATDLIDTLSESAEAIASDLPDDLEMTETLCEIETAVREGENRYV